MFAREGEARKGGTDIRQRGSCRREITILIPKRPSEIHGEVCSRYGIQKLWWDGPRGYGAVLSGADGTGTTQAVTRAFPISDHTKILAEEQMSPLSPETAKAKLQQLALIMELTGKSSWSGVRQIDGTMGAPKPWWVTALPVFCAMYDFAAFILSFFWCGSEVGQSSFRRAIHGLWQAPMLQLFIIPFSLFILNPVGVNE